MKLANVLLRIFLVLIITLLSFTFFSCEESDNESIQEAQQYSPKDFDKESRIQSIESAHQIFSFENKNKMASSSKDNSFLSKERSSTSKIMETDDLSVIKIKEYIGGGKLELLGNGTFVFTPRDLNNHNPDYAFQIWYRKESNIRNNIWQWESRAWYPSQTYNQINKNLANLRSSSGEYFIIIQQYNKSISQWELLDVVDTNTYPYAARFLITQSLTGEWGIDKINSKASIFIFKNCPISIENDGGDILGNMVAKINGNVDFTFDFKVPSGNYQCDGGLNLPVNSPLVANSFHSGTYNQTFILGTTNIKPAFDKTTSVISNASILNLKDNDDNPLVFDFIVEPMTLEEYAKFSLKLTLRNPIEIHFGLLTVTFEEGTIFLKDIE
jgi:hypothetical protein